MAGVSSSNTVRLALASTQPAERAVTLTGRLPSSTALSIIVRLNSWLVCAPAPWQYDSMPLQFAVAKRSPFSLLLFGASTLSQNCGLKPVSGSLPNRLSGEPLLRPASHAAFHLIASRPPSLCLPKMAGPARCSCRDAGAQ